jgi:hypothetical protein
MNPTLTSASIGILDKSENDGKPEFVKRTEGVMGEKED